MNFAFEGLVGVVQLSGTLERRFRGHRDFAVEFGFSFVVYLPVLI